MFMEEKKLTREEKETLKDIKHRSKRFLAISMAFNIVMLACMIYAMFVSGNIMYIMPFGLLNVIVGVFVLTKSQDMLREAEVIKGIRDADDSTLMDGLIDELKDFKAMLSDKGFWDILLSDIKEGIQEFLRKARR
jgi:hypothetical protein